MQIVMPTKFFRLTLVLILFHMIGYGQSEGMVRINGSCYIPLYGRDSTVVKVKDFNSVLLSGDSRKDNDKDNNLFCGSAALGATDLMNYAAFMRYAFRGSIKANYNIKNLGFRCAKDINNTK